MTTTKKLSVFIATLVISITAFTCGFSMIVSATTLTQTTNVLQPTYWGNDEYTYEFTVTFTAEVDMTTTKLEASAITNAGRYEQALGHNIESFRNVTLKAGETISFDLKAKRGNGYPSIRENYVSLEYRLVGKDANGNQIILTQIFEISQDLSKAIDKSDTDHDLVTLRYNADFEIEVADGVYWVPANSLGGSQYTNDEIRAMLNKTPEQKQEAIGTLYEAIQLYQVGEFANSDDAKREYWQRNINEGNISLQYGLPGYDAVRVNFGNCSGSSSWLSYILADDYDEMGFIYYYEANGQGHVWNYFKQDGWYYFIDMTAYRVEDTWALKESGLLSDYRNNIQTLHKAESIQAYVDYYVTIVTNHQIAIVYTNTSSDVIGGGSYNNTTTRIHLLPKYDGVEYKFWYDNGKLKYEFVDPPTVFPDWSNVPSFNWNSIMKKAA